MYKLTTQSKSSIIVTSLDTGKKMPVQATHKISALEDISIYTYEEDLPLAEVFKKIAEKEDGGKAINHKADKEELRNYMSEVLPNYDEDRVYDSDLKKLFQWYNILQANDLINAEEEEVEESEEKTSEE